MATSDSVGPFIGLVLVIAFVYSIFGKAKIPRSKAEVSPAPLKGASTSKQWSGKDTGPFTVKSLTREQSYCLMALADGENVRKEGVLHEKGMRHFASRTLTSLVKHGFAQEDGKGGFVVTDHGLNAYNNLPWR
ncbi:MAG: hypothetical protein WCH44_06305 [Betaproteobacteria bacterium]